MLKIGDNNNNNNNKVEVKFVWQISNPLQLVPVWVAILVFKIWLQLKNTVFKYYNFINEKKWLIQNCHPAPCFLNRDKLFLTLSDQYRNPERRFQLPEQNHTSFEASALPLSHHGRFPLRVLFQQKFCPFS